MDVRNRDSSTAWKSASDGVLDGRVFPCQNWRADVSAVIDAAGQMVEWVKYRAYGAPFGFPAGDTDSDGDKDSTDEATVSGWSGGYDVRADLDLDGDIDATDDFLCSALQSMNQGRAALSRSDVENRKGYAGYENSYEITRFSHVRHRVLDAELGRWITRDPVGYVDGPSLTGYCSNLPAIATDPSGNILGLLCVGCLLMYAGTCGTMCGLDYWDTPGETWLDCMGTNPATIDLTVCDSRV